MPSLKNVDAQYLKPYETDEYNTFSSLVMQATISITLRNTELR
jgi:hypothetical protein